MRGGDIVGECGLHRRYVELGERVPGVVAQEVAVVAERLDVVENRRDRLFVELLLDLDDEHRTAPGDRRGGPREHLHLMAFDVDLQQVEALELEAVDRHRRHLDHRGRPFGPRPWMHRGPAFRAGAGRRRPERRRAGLVRRRGGDHTYVTGRDLADELDEVRKRLDRDHLARPAGEPERPRPPPRTDVHRDAAGGQQLVDTGDLAFVGPMDAGDRVPSHRRGAVAEQLLRKTGWHRTRSVHSADRHGHDARWSFASADSTGVRGPGRAPPRRERGRCAGRAPRRCRGEGPVRRCRRNARVRVAACVADRERTPR